MPDYQYSEAAFTGLTGGNDINLTCLHQEVLDSAISPEVLDGILREGGFVTFTFDLSLDAGDETILDGIVAAHTGENCEVQQDVTFPCCITVVDNVNVGGDINVDGTVDGVDIGSPKDSIEVDTNQYHLVGDVASPGVDKFYGTNDSGVRGWYDKNGGTGNWDSTKDFGNKSKAGNRFLNALGAHMESNHNSLAVPFNGQIVHVSVSVSAKDDDPLDDATIQIVKNAFEGGSGQLSGGTQIGSDLDKNNNQRYQLFTGLTGYTFSAGDVISVYVKKNPDELRRPFVRLYLRYN